MAIELLRRAGFIWLWASLRHKFSIATNSGETIAKLFYSRDRGGMYEQKVSYSLITIVGMWLGLLAAAQAQVVAENCGPVWGTKHYGPLDYRKSRSTLASIVEPYHFTPQVESLFRGESAPIGGDLNYTLRASPNHHRALISAALWAKRQKNPQPIGMAWPIECYFERAIRFAPDDVVVRGLYAQWLGEAGRRVDAERQLETALLLAKDNPISNYSIGLLYFELGAHERALDQAHRAQQLGWTKPELADKLKQAGKWREPVVEEPSAKPADTAASASDRQR